MMEYLMGYKGVSVMDAGYFYCPYITLSNTLPSKETGFWKKYIPGDQEIEPKLLEAADYSNDEDEGSIWEEV